MASDSEGPTGRCDPQLAFHWNKFDVPMLPDPLLYVLHDAISIIGAWASR